MPRGENAGAPIDRRTQKALREAYEAAAESLDRLNEKESRFVWEYLIEANGTTAAIRAGYSERSAYSTANRLLKKADVAAALGAVRRGLEDRTKITVEMVVEELGRIAFSDPGEVAHWDATGVDLFDSDSLPERVRRTIKRVTVKRKRKLEMGIDGRPEPWEVEESSFELHDKVSALDRLAKRLGMYEKGGGDGNDASLAFIRAVLEARRQLRERDAGA